MPQSIKLRLLTGGLLCCRQIGIGNDRQLHTVRHRLPFAQTVNVHIMLVMRSGNGIGRADLATEYHIIGPALIQKAVADFGHNAHIIRMHALKHAGFEP